MIRYDILRSSAVTPAVRLKANGQDITEPALRRSWRLVQLSATGFEYGYVGTGPDQLAHAILLDYATETGALDPAALAQEHYRAFAAAFIAPQAFEADGRTRIMAFAIEGRAIQAWLTARPRPAQGARYI